MLQVHKTPTVSLRTYFIRNSDLIKTQVLTKVLTPYPHNKIKKSTFSGVSEDFIKMFIFGPKKQEIQEKTGKSHLWISAKKLYRAPSFGLKRNSFRKL